MLTFINVSISQKQCNLITLLWKFSKHFKKFLSEAINFFIWLFASEDVCSIFKTWYFHGDEDSSHCLLGCDTI